MSKRYLTRKKYFYGISAVLIFIVIVCGIYLSVEKPASSPEMDGIVRKIAVNFIRQALESTQSLEDAALKVGVDSHELKRLCIALDINMDFASREVEPVQLSSLEKLSNNYYEVDVILKYNWLSPYVLLVDKNTHTLHLLHYENGKRTVVNTFECKTGKNHGDKKKEGDNRTPEGTYFFVNKYSRADLHRLVGRGKAYQYGDMAFATNFPNSIDRIDSKRGGGIWLHGTDEPFNETSTNDTRGCVVTTNEVINIMSRYIELYLTPLVIVNKLNMVKKQDIERKSSKVLVMVDEWRKSWVEKRIDDYITYYSPSFRSQGMNRTQWKQRKTYYASINGNVNITLDNFMIFQHNGGIIVQFLQVYSAANTSSVGFKALYLIPGGNSWEIITEYFRKK